MQLALSKSLDTALDLLFPPHCASCQAALPADSNKALCRSCAQRVHWIGSDRCQRCGDASGQGAGVMHDCPSCRTHPPVFVHSACTVARYAEGPLRQLILALKFGHKLHIVKLFGALIAQRVQATNLALPEMIVVPAPVTRTTLYSRAFNQSEEIASCAARRLSLPLVTGLLKKIRHTPPQATLTHEERRQNLKNAFACDAKVASRYKDRPVLLVDDVITTCATISECARTLNAVGLGEIRAAAIARG